MISDLNEQQKEAVLQITGPVMVFAGAGTGKTRTLTYRVAYMIKEGGINPYNILAITFTNKATNEMKQRLMGLIGMAYYSVTITTFHSFCARVLRRDIETLGYNRHFDIIDDDEQLKIINGVLKDGEYSKTDYPGKKVQKTINFAKCFDGVPDDPVIAEVMRLYEEKTKELNILDFGDLLLKVHKLFSKYPDILEKYAQRYEYVLVDEFQDTNLIQYHIMRMLTRKNRNFFVVGDDDQSIYSFRGTNYENMNIFKKDYPEFKLFHLTQNYRSTPDILKGCNRLISFNKNREKKELYSRLPGGERDVIIYQAFSEKIEAGYIADTIVSGCMRGESFSSFAVLSRKSSLLRNIEINLLQMSIPYKVYGGISYFRRKEIKDVIAYFRLILNNDDVFSFSRIVNVPPRSVGSVTLRKILDIRTDYGVTLFEAISSCKSLISAARYKELMQFKDMIIGLGSLLETTDLILIYEELLKRISYREYLKESEDDEDRLENIEEFKSVLFQFDNEFPDLSQREKLQMAFDEALLAEDKAGKSEQKDNTVILSTIHSAKGLEFNTVFVIGLEENVFPASYRDIDENEMEEERRIAYVAFTRAKKNLYLMYAQNRLLFGQSFANPPSRFLMEFQGIDQKKYQSGKLPGAEVLYGKKLSDSVAYKPGDKVFHKIFGPGIVISVQANTAHIFFDNCQSLKKIITDHPALNKR